MSEDERARIYQRYVSTHVGTTSSAAVSWFPVLEHVPNSANTSLLDLGCGSGALLEAAGQLGIRNLKGIDVSPEQVELASRLGRDYVQQGDVFDFLTSGQWRANCVTTVDLLEHLSRREVLNLAEAIATYLPIRGIWIGQVPNAVSPFFGNYAYGDLTHETFFTARSIRQLTGLAGLELVHVGPVGVAPGGGLSRLARRMTFATVQWMLKGAIAAETGVRDHIVTQNLVFVARKTIN